jgi:hypothetical protein
MRTAEQIAKDWGADGVVTGDEIRSLVDTAKATIRGERALVKLGIARRTQSQDHGFRYWQNISGLPFKSINAGGAENDIQAQERLARYFGGESVGSGSYYGPTGTEAEADVISGKSIEESVAEYVENEPDPTEAVDEYVENPITTTQSSVTEEASNGKLSGRVLAIGAALVLGAVAVLGGH